MSMTRISARAGWALLAGFTFLSAAHGQQIHRYPFETRETVFTRGTADAPFRELVHEITDGTARGGQHAEHLQIVSEPGSSIYYYYPTAKAPLTDDLNISIFMRANRPGAQILARLVLPKERNPSNLDEPLTTLLRGDVYQPVSRWNKIEVRRPKNLAKKQQQIMRAQLERDVDFTDAYVDQILINAYSGPGMTEMWLDDLEIGPVVAETAPFKPASREGVKIAPGGVRPRSPGQAMVVELVHDQLIVNGKKLFFRGIKHSDTPLKVLRDAGFNSIWLDSSTSPAALEEALSYGFLLVPSLASIDRNNGRASTTAIQSEVSRFLERDAVLFWDLGGSLTEESADDIGQLARTVRNVDANRPLGADIWDGFRPYSRNLDLIGAHRWPLMTGLELTQYRDWLNQRRLLGRHGAFLWTWVQTHLPEWYTSLVYERPSAAGFDEPIGPQPEQIRLLTYIALASGCRGLGFWSDRFLADSHQGRDRLLTLAMLNQEMKLLEPLLVSTGEPLWIETSIPEVKAAILRTTNGMLVLPMWLGKGAQFVPGQSATVNLSMVIPQVMVGTQPWEVGPGEVRLLAPERVTGGTKITIPEFGLTTAIVFTADNGPNGVLTRFQEQARQMGRPAAQWATQLAEEELRKVTRIQTQLAESGHAIAESQQMLDKAEKLAKSAADFYNKGQFRESQAEAHRALRPLRILMRIQWERAVKDLSSAVASPFGVSYFTLPQHWRLIEAVARAQPSANVLQHGDFEFSPESKPDSWLPQQSKLDEVELVARRVSDDPQQGRQCLMLQVNPRDPQRAPVALERSFLAVSSPTVRLQPGSWVRVTGWVRIPKALTASVDGALFYDNSGGEPLAIRLTEACAWRQLVLFRRVPPSGEMNVTLAMTGLGTVYFDDVRIEPLLVTTQAAQ